MSFPHHSVCQADLQKGQQRPPLLCIAPAIHLHLIHSIFRVIVYLVLEKLAVHPISSADGSHKRQSRAEERRASCKAQTDDDSLHKFMQAAAVRWLSCRAGRSWNKGSLDKPDLSRLRHRRLILPNHTMDQIYRRPPCHVALSTRQSVYQAPLSPYRFYFINVLR